MDFLIKEESWRFSKSKALQEDLRKCIYRAGEDLYLRDSYLIANENAHVAERSIVFRFGLYLEQCLRSSKRLMQYHLDCEYNRNLDDPKRIASRPNGSAPDLIVHRRGTNEDNLLIVECKGYWAEEHQLEQDRVKLREFLTFPYFYTFGLLIRFERESMALE